MMIEEIVRYRFNGQEFNSLPDVAQHVEDEIGKVIDSTPHRLAAVDRLAIFEALVKNRVRLVKLLSAEFLIDPNEMHATAQSIFEL